MTGRTAIPPAAAFGGRCLAMTLVGAILIGTALAPIASARIAGAQFILKGTNGYRLAVEAGGGAYLIILKRGLPPLSASKPPRANALSVTASLKTPKGGSLSSYTSRATVSRTGFSGDLGRFGKVDVTFKPQRKHRLRTLGHCSGYLEKEVGRYRGLVRFAGEGDYTDAEATHAHGWLIVDHHFRCRRGGGGSGGLHYTELTAKTPDGGQGFDAVRFHGEGPPIPTLFDAFSKDHVGRVVITHAAFAQSPSPSAFTYSGLTSASVAPPPPFTGTADFSSPSSWTGSLSASFPGAPNVALAGTAFSATLKRH